MGLSDLQIIRFNFVPPWHQTTGCRRSQTSSPASAPWHYKCRQTWTVLLPGQTPHPQSNTGKWRILKKQEASVKPIKPNRTRPTAEAPTHLPLADCLAVILSVSLRPVSRSWRPATEPVCTAVWGFQKEISPFRVATANSWPSGRYVTHRAERTRVFYLLQTK